jgi:hypothetical protein
MKRGERTVESLQIVEKDKLIVSNWLNGTWRE